MLQEHDKPRAAGSPAPCVRIIMADTARWLPLLEEVFRGANGAVVTAADHRSGVNAQCDVLVDLPELLARANTLLDEILPGTRLAVDVGEIVTFESSSPVPVTNTATQVLAGLMCSVFHPRLRDASITAVLWQESALDDVTGDRVAAFLSELPDLLHLPSAKTLVLVSSETKIDYGRHCVGPGAVRYQLGDRGLLRRQPYEASKLYVEHLASLSPASAPAIVLVLGAGAVTHLGFPTGNELRDEALDRYLGSAGAGMSFEDQAVSLFNQLGAVVPPRLREAELLAGPESFVANLTLERVLREEKYREGIVGLTETLRDFDRRHDATLAARDRSAFPTALGRLVALQQRLVILTVNFDQSLEDEVGPLLQPFITEADFEEFPKYLASYLVSGGPVPYVKLHGDIKTPSTVVANVDDTEPGLSEARLNAIRAVRSLPGPVNPWVYVGYSMRDIDINGLIGTLDFGDGLVEYWVGPEIDPAVVEFMRRSRLPRWEMLRTGYGVHDRYVTLTAGEYLGLLSNSLGVA